MLDKMLEIGSTFDWISPVWAWIQDRRNGPHHTYIVEFGGGWSGNDIAKLLKRKGIGSWGRMVVDGKIMITVREAQAEYGERLLVDAGVPLLNRLHPDAAHSQRGGCLRLFLGG